MNIGQIYQNHRTKELILVLDVGMMARYNNNKVNISPSITFILKHYIVLYLEQDGKLECIPETELFNFVLYEGDEVLHKLLIGYVDEVYRSSLELPYESIIKYVEITFKNNQLIIYEDDNGNWYDHSKLNNKQFIYSLCPYKNCILPVYIVYLDGSKKNLIDDDSSEIKHSLLFFNSTTTVQP